MAINSGSTNYSNDFDLYPTTAGATLSYVTDQERSLITGLITVSGTPIRGLQVNSVYNSIQAIEKTLGKNPQSIFSDVNARFQAIAISGAGAGVFLEISGGTMMGNLALNTGVNFLAISPNSSNIGDITNPFNTAHINTIQGGTNPFIVNGTQGAGYGTRLSLGDNTVAMYGWNGGSTSKLSISETDAYIYGWNSGPVTRLSLTDSQSIMAGYISGYGPINRLGLTDTQLQFKSYIAGYGQIDTITSSPSDFTMNGYVSGYGQFSRMVSNDSNFYVRTAVVGQGYHDWISLNDSNATLKLWETSSSPTNVFDAQYSSLTLRGRDTVTHQDVQRAYLTDSNITFNGWNSSIHSSYYRMDIADAQTYIYGYDSTSYNQYNRLYLSDSDTYIYGRNNSHLNTYSRMQLSDSQSYILGYDSASNNSYNRLSLADAQTYIYGRDNVSNNTYNRAYFSDAQISLYGRDTVSNNTPTLLDLQFGQADIKGWNSTYLTTISRLSLTDAGIAVNGFDSSTGNPQYELLSVQDSGFNIKEYLSPGPASTSIIEGNSVLTQVHSSGLKVDGDIGANITGTQDIGSSSIHFRTLYVDNISGASIGNYVAISGSTMTGNLTMNTGLSIVMNTVNIGRSNTANGTDSIVVGNSSYAGGNRTLVIGNTMYAAGDDSSSVGVGNSVGSNSRSSAFGYHNNTNADDCTSIGQSNQAGGVNATNASAVGYANVSISGDSSAFGNRNETRGERASTFGYHNIASGTNSSAIGYENKSIGAGTTVVGNSVTGILSDTLYLGCPNGVMIQSGKNILPEASGTQNLGSLTLPFSGIYVKSINNVASTINVFMEKPVGFINSSNKDYTLAHAPCNNSLALFKNGVLMTPSGVDAVFMDYTLSNNIISFINPPSTGAFILAQSYQYLS